MTDRSGCGCARYTGRNRNQKLNQGGTVNHAVSIALGVARALALTALGIIAGAGLGAVGSEVFQPGAGLEGVVWLLAGGLLGGIVGIAFAIWILRRDRARAD